MFAGLSAFPLTPSRDGSVDPIAYRRLVSDAVTAGADSISALGSTGAAAYLSRTDRAALARVAVEAAGDVPVIVGVGAIGTTAVLGHVEDAAVAGAAGILLPALSYQPLGDDEVYGLFEDVTSRFPGMPVVLYDNPATTRVVYSDELRTAIARLPGIVSIKLAGLPAAPEEASAFVARVRAAAGEGVSIGISGDAAAVHGLAAGCDVWYSVLGGTFPHVCRRLATAAHDGAPGDGGPTAAELSSRLAPIWRLFAAYGSFRVTAALATLSGILPADAVYAPVRPLAGDARREVAAALAEVEPLLR